MVIVLVCVSDSVRGRSVGLSVCRHVFSRTVAVVDTKRGYVGRYNGCAAQQEAGADSSKNGIFTWGPKIIYSYYTRCVLIKDRQTTEETCIRAVNSLNSMMISSTLQRLNPGPFVLGNIPWLCHS